MRKTVIALLVLAPLLAACGKAEEPLFSELKGRWAPPSMAQASDKIRAQQISNPGMVDKDICRIMHVSFAKKRIVMSMMGVGMTLFHIMDAKREGSRIIITGTADGDKNPAAQGKLVLLLRDGQVRFDDVFDERGRSLRYERLPDDDRMRKHGANTLGDSMKLILDLKPCQQNA
jgi:hypothetical protein